MPIYEYACRNCGQHFDKLQSFNDEPIRVCPHCGGETRRVLHPVGVIFKGSGWYVTDSRKSAPAASGDNGTKAEGDKAGDTKPETSTPKTDTPASTTPSTGD